MMPWRTHIAAAVAAVAIAAVPASAQTMEELQAENIRLRTELNEFQRYDAALANDYDYVTNLAGELRARVDRQAATIRRLRAAAAPALSSYDLFTVAAMVMTPGGHARLGPRGWLSAETGTVGDVSSAVRVRTGLRGWRVRVWEDGSLRVWYHGHALFTACITGKGCED